MIDQLCAAPNQVGKVVVLGIGNSLRGDEGVGIHALNRLLQTQRLAEHVQAIDGGVLGPELLPRLEGCAALLVIDAINAEKAPGPSFAWKAMRHRPCGNKSCRCTKPG